MKYTNHDLQSELVLLSEGELDRDQCGQLFDRLDNEPESWKLCALALLEQRSLQQTLPIGSTAKPGAQAFPIQKPLGSTLAKPPVVVAASHVIAFLSAACLFFALGVFFNSTFDWTSQLRATTAGNQGETGKKGEVQSANPDFIRAMTLALKASVVDDCEVLGVLDLGSKNQPHVIPIVKSNELELLFRNSPEPALSQVIARDLKAAGWELNSHKQLVSFSLPGGQKRTLPVDMLNYRFVGRDTF